MNKLNNFELHEGAMNLSAVHTSYSLARQLLQQKQELEQLKEKYEKLNDLFEDYLKCPRVMVEEIERLQMQKSTDPDVVEFNMNLSVDSVHRRL